MATLSCQVANTRLNFSWAETDVFYIFHLLIQGRETPVGVFRDLIQLVQVLPGKNAAAFRIKAANYLCRLLSGDLSLIPEIIHTNQVVNDGAREALLQDVPRPESVVLAGALPPGDRELLDKLCTQQGKNNRLTIGDKRRMDIGADMMKTHAEMAMTKRLKTEIEKTKTEIEKAERMNQLEIEKADKEIEKAERMNQLDIEKAERLAKAEIGILHAQAEVAKAQAKAARENETILINRQNAAARAHKKPTPGQNFFNRAR